MLVEDIVQDIHPRLDALVEVFEAEDAMIDEDHRFAAMKHSVEPRPAIEPSTDVSDRVFGTTRGRRLSSYRSDGCQLRTRSPVANRYQAFRIARFDRTKKARIFTGFAMDRRFTLSPPSATP